MAIFKTFPAIYIFFYFSGISSKFGSTERQLTKNQVEGLTFMGGISYSFGCKRALVHILVFCCTCATLNIY